MISKNSTLPDPKIEPEKDVTINFTLGHDKVLVEKDERVVWEGFLRGDESSLIYIYRKYANSLYRYGIQFTKQQELVSDCIQEMFYELIEKRSKLSPADSVKAYLFATLKRRLLRHLKREGLTQSLEGFNFELALNATFIYPVIEENEYAIIQNKLNDLPINQREVILLHFYEGLSYSEIAVIMGIKVRSARALTYRALDSLKSQLQPHKNSLYAIVGLFFIA